MTFATEIAKRRTNRATLVRLNPRRYISETLASEGAGIYSMANSLIISSIERNGTALTSDSTDPTVNDHYYYNETTGEITIKLASAPNSTTNVVIAYYYLFYTSGLETEYHQIPTDTSTTKRFWDNRLNGSPNFISSLDGLEAGIVSIPDAGVEINDIDDVFSSYLTTNDSFSNVEILIWQEINNQFRKAYSGTVNNLTVDRNVTISFSDQTSLLNKTAYFGDDFDECINVTSAAPKDLFKPIPIWLAAETKSITNAYLLLGSAIFAEIQEGQTAYCSSFTADLTTSNNRTWTLCRLAGSLKTQTFGSITRVDNVGGFYYLWQFASYTNLNHGDTISWTEAGNTYYAVIVSVSALISYGGLSYNVCAASTGRAGTLTTSSTMNAKKTLSLQITDSDGGRHFPLQTVDYTISETATAGGNSIVKITFVNAAETAIGLTSDPIDPNAIDLQYSLENDATLTHGTILKSLLDAAGCTTNAASFTAADSALTDTTAFSIPFIGETDYQNYLQYIQKLLESTLGFLKQNDDNEISYHLLAAPTTPSITRDSDQFVSEIESSIDVEYRDIITELVPRNNHISIFGDDAPDGTIRSEKARYLHGTVKSVIIDHVLQSDPNGKIGRQDEILALRSNRNLRLSYETETVDLDTIVGDEVTVETSKVDGSTIDIIVTGTNKSEEQTKVTGTDLLGL